MFDPIPEDQRHQEKNPADGMTAFRRLRLLLLA